MDNVFSWLDKKKKPERKSGLPGFEDLPEADQHKELVKMFKDVFSSEKGKIVLCVMLEDMHYFNSAVGPEEEALSNYAKKIVREYLGNESNMDITERLIS